MSCSCGSKSTKSCKCKDKKYTSGITYDGEQLVCNQGGISRFTINPCSDLNTVIQILSEKICELYGIGTTNANSVWVDAVYGDDETGEYGNLGKPFKTIVAAQIAAYNYMNSNPNLYDMSGTTYKVRLIGDTVDTDTEIVSIDAPRVRIHVASGVYYGADDFQYIADNIDQFNEEAFAGNPPEALKLNNSFNLMMPYVDYELDAGATLIEYGFNVYFTIPEIVDGYSPYYYNIEPPDNGMLTRVFGNGTLFCSKTVAPYFSFGLTLSIYLEPNCVLEIDCEQHNLMGYFYGGTFKSRTKTYILPLIGFQESEIPAFGGIVAIYFDQEEDMPNDPTSTKHEIISENIIVDWGGREDLLDDSNVTLYGSNFIFASKSYDLVCNNYMGRRVATNYIDGQYSPIYSRDRDNAATLQWLYNYFTTFSANEYAPMIYNGNYYDNNEMICNIDIKHAKFGIRGIYCENNGNGVATNQRITTNINIPIVDMQYWYQLFGGLEGSFSDTTNFYLSGYGDENNLINCPNSHVTVRSANDPQIDGFYGGGVDNFATILSYGEFTDGFRFFGKIRTRLLESVASVDIDRMNSFLKAGTFSFGVSENIALDNCIFYSENNTAKDNFFGSTLPGPALTDYNIKLFSNCYTNTIDIWDDGVGGPINVINTIPETKLIVSSNVKI
jgi:hypothetical protein